MIKKISFSIFVLFTGFIFVDAINKTSAGHPSSTGAPGEQTCARSTCHEDASIVSNSTANKFTFSDPKNTYNMNGYYSISIECNLSGIEKFGFQVVAFDSATGSNAGSWLLTEPSRMQIINGESPFTSRKYITHNSAGTVPVSAGKAKWGFKWKAPSTNKGTIMFYYVVNATNKNDKAAGDQLHFSNFKIRYSPNSISVNDPKASKPVIKVNKDHILISAGNQPISSFEILTLDGKVVFSSRHIKSGEPIEINDFKQTGSAIYIYRLQTDSGSYGGKLML